MIIIVSRSSLHVTQSQTPVTAVDLLTWLLTCQQDQWGHLEEIELVNDGSGLGFGIVGGKTAGVVVRTLVRNSVADKVS